MDTVPNSIERRRRIVQDHLLIWLDESMDETNKDYKHILTQIQTGANNVNVFTQRDECVDFISDNENIKSFLVVENTIAQHIIPFINDVPQLDGVYIFSDIEILQEEWTTKCQKIKSVHSNINDLCKSLQSCIKTCNQDSIAVSFLTVTEIDSTDNLNQLEPTFMYTQIFKDILLDMKHGEQAITEFTSYCRQNKFGSAINIDRFEKEYHAQSAIWWYTYPSYIYSMLNYALRSMEADTIINMGFLIHDLHIQIHHLHQQQINTDHSKPFTVYRGQGLSKSNFEKLKKTEGGLMSFNNFLSTSTEQEIASGFAYSASQNADMVGILFIMSIDPCIKSAPFASIKDKSYFKDEEEILFSMHTVFRVGAIKVMDINNQLYQVELQLTSDDDQQLRLLTDRIREEAGGSTGWQRLGDLLLKIGQFNKAEELYHVLIEQTSHEDEKQYYYNRLGYVKDEQGDYEKAIWYHQQGVKIYQKTRSLNHPLLATSYSNIGSVYDKMEEYSKALSYYKIALEILQKFLPSNHSDVATSYNNIGNVYNHMGEHSKAVLFYEKALEIFQKTLPSNHPSLAASYNNIGTAYNMMGQYSKVLTFYEKSLEIYRKTLPSNHPHLATLYGNISNVYENMGECPKALSFYEKAFGILKTNLPSNHPNLAVSYNNIALMYDKMGEYSKALLSHEKALEICQKTLPSNDPHLATLYSNISNVYDNMGEYSKALSIFKKAFGILKTNLPSNHPDLAISYNDIGLMYDKMGEYSEALSFYEKAFEIYKKTLHQNHPHLAISYNDIGLMYDKMGDYSKALSLYEKALEIYKKTLHQNHPHFAASYSNIGSVYSSIREYSKALSFYEKVLEIDQKTLPSNHPSLATSYNDIGLVYNKMGDYPIALSYHEKALEIFQKTLPSNHPDLATSYNNIGWVYRNMKDYSKTLSYYERALNIWQCALPSTHPHIKNVKNSIEIVKKEIIKSI
ncbi:unnamed protein product [Adineta steineri]|uniref:NAD(P)(+)--arginine ADP-ribosyltransferase n=2 Tax=Adineta steineri TaxID=433720 RepID=A0A813N7V9_9BILA|nr:unnamed protein product [Adineta steineri]CAF1247340.1 unnamed protein product [Adineta steineri]CAF1276078.1 unnamed protein product [Adineta steineri]